MILIETRLRNGVAGPVVEQVIPQSIPLAPKRVDALFCVRV
jgi:hypothetical protein